MAVGGGLLDPGQQGGQEFGFPFEWGGDARATGNGAERNGEDEGEEGEVEEEEVVRPTLSNLTQTRGVGSQSISKPGANNYTSSTALTTTTGKHKLRVRRSTFVPGWAVPPRVLLVDDDAISRKLGSKFLQVFGCTIDVAVDGVAAVDKMNLEKYDLVLMDIVMPKLDGVSATSIIRKFDCMTPIISMTSNSKPNEILTYYSSGMNDILPKPFTKQGLLDVLEKHLMHLKAIQQMSRIPRSLELPSTSSSANRPSSSSPSTSSQPYSAASTSQDLVGTGNEGLINPIAGLGLTDEQYNLIVQGIVDGETFRGMDMGPLGSGMGLSMGMGMGYVGVGEKRVFEDVTGPSGSGSAEGEGRAGKRSRFEIIE
ncbi:hypothetical protein AMATHDRAFT_154935 [Amanita thiersii Skay4041]|uniref:Response regulatory domain-containing protein n=1 Tax=Amanita thiersii Skay4041 TaxID=703135 RepID=A0A2A9NFN2_9AGAR|nr:hypothetical protein AMATHDRAFT_154935 [Amanita thiersii Skay4041]